jgi:hypothetical protein
MMSQAVGSVQCPAPDIRNALPQRSIIADADSKDSQTGNCTVFFPQIDFGACAPRE